MARNDDRRRALLDAAIRVLASLGARGLTHRAIDAQAEVPVGTTSNYFRTRDALVAGLFERISERLKPDDQVHAELAKRRPSRALFADYIRDIVTRLTTERDVTLALLELRLESSRSPEVAERVRQWLHAGFAADVAFTVSAGLPGGAKEIALFHYALDGLLLDRLTTPIDPATSLDEVVKLLVDRLLPPKRETGSQRLRPRAGAARPKHER
jgi:DNA-binding transcriptional regulator YbjK